MYLTLAVRNNTTVLTPWSVWIFCLIIFALFMWVDCLELRAYSWFRLNLRRYWVAKVNMPCFALPWSGYITKYEELILLRQGLGDVPENTLI